MMVYTNTRHVSDVSPNNESLCTLVKDALTQAEKYLDRYKRALDMVYMHTTMFRTGEKNQCLASNTFSMQSTEP
jgi:hypothetical protein